MIHPLRRSVRRNAEQISQKFSDLFPNGFPGAPTNTIGWAALDQIITGWEESVMPPIAALRRCATALSILSRSGSSLAVTRPCGQSAALIPRGAAALPTAQRDFLKISSLTSSFPPFVAAGFRNCLNLFRDRLPQFVLPLDSGVLH